MNHGKPYEGRRIYQNFKKGMENAVASLCKVH
jgi:hypothetical protein